MKKLKRVKEIEELCNCEYGKHDIKSRACGNTLAKQLREIKKNDHSGISPEVAQSWYEL